jgi:hypothetical protein
MGDDEMAVFEEGMSANQLLEKAAKRMMGKQADADKTPEIIADYAWIRNDEIEGDCVEMWPFLIGQEDATDAVAKFVNDERWPVRIMANLTNFMLSISNDDPEQFSWNNENRDRRVLSEWLDQYREEDPDPTEP